MPTSSRDVLRLGAETLGLTLSDEQIEAMLTFVDILYAANEALNLTRVPREDAVPRHLLESLTVLAAADVPGGSRILDLGSGGGIPGIPLAIARPAWRVVLMDARRRKVDFIRGAVGALGLQHAEPVHARAEEAASEAGYRGAFDMVVARAVAPLDRLAGWMAPFLAPDGVALAMKGGRLDDELAEAMPAIRKARLALNAVVPTPVPFLDAERAIVVMRSASPKRTRGRAAT